MAAPMLKLVAVVRFSDKTVVASHATLKGVSKQVVLDSIAGQSNVITGKKYSTTGTTQSVHFSLDAYGRVYAIVADPSYNPRIAFSAIDELIYTFGKEFGPKCANATENSLSKPAQPLLSGTLQKYMLPETIDPIARAQSKIDVVTNVMKENIAQIQQNQVLVENIEEKSIMLNETASKFSSDAKDLKSKMCWKKWKMRLLIGGLIVAVLLVIIVPIAVTENQSGPSSAPSK